MLPACRTAGDKFAIPTFDLTPGTGSVSCNSVFVRYLGRFLHQEELMEPEATVQNPSSHCRDLTCGKMHPDNIMHNPVHL